jgi:hypothetical protein
MANGLISAQPISTVRGGLLAQRQAWPMELGMVRGPWHSDRPTPQPALDRAHTVSSWAGGPP